MYFLNSKIMLFHITHTRVYISIANLKGIKRAIKKINIVIPKLRDSIFKIMSSRGLNYIYSRIPCLKTTFYYLENSSFHERPDTYC